MAMKYKTLEQWYDEYAKNIFDKKEFSEFEKYLNDRSQNGSHTLDEWEELYGDFCSENKKSVRKSIKESSEFYFEFIPLKNKKLKDYAKDLYYDFADEFDYSEDDITWHLSKDGIGFQGKEDVVFKFQDYILDNIYKYGDYSLENEDYELKESKKSAKKSMNEKVDTKYKKVLDHRNDEYEIMRFDDYNFQVIAVPNNKSLFSKDVPSLNVEKAYIYDTCKNAKDVTLFVGIVEELGWCFIAFDKLANNDNIFAYYISGKDKHDAYMAFHEYKSEFDLINESKKSARKSMKESFDDGDQLVIDVVDMLILDFGYDKKTVEKYFYKIHKLNDFDTISIDEYIKIKEEIEKVLGYDDIF